MGYGVSIWYVGGMQ